MVWWIRYKTGSAIRFLHDLRHALAKVFKFGHLMLGFQIHIYISTYIKGLIFKGAGHLSTWKAGMEKGN